MATPTPITPTRPHVGRREATGREVRLVGKDCPHAVQTSRQTVTGVVFGGLSIIVVDAVALADAVIPRPDATKRVIPAATTAPPPIVVVDAARLVVVAVGLVGVVT